MSHHEEPNGNPNIDGYTISEADHKVYTLLMPASEASRLEIISGQLAYAQYALQKHQFIQVHMKEEGAPPSGADIMGLIRNFKTANGSTLEVLKESAKSLLKEYAEEYAHANADENVVSPLKNYIDKKQSFGKALLTSLAAAFVYSFVVACIVFTLTVSFPDSKFSKIYDIIVSEDGALVAETTGGETADSPNQPGDEGLNSGPNPSSPH